MAHKHLVSISLLACYQSNNSRCKSQVLENALSHHIISAALLLQLAGQTETHSLILLCWYMLSLPVCYSSDFKLLVPYWLPLFPGWQLDHDLRSQMGLKGGLNFLKGRGKWRACVRVWEINVRQRQNERPTSSLQFTTNSDHESILRKAFELCKGQARDWNLTILLHCASAGTYNTNVYPLSPFTVCMDVRIVSITSGLQEEQAQPTGSLFPA